MSTTEDIAEIRRQYRYLKDVAGISTEHDKRCYDLCDAYEALRSRCAELETLYSVDENVKLRAKVEGLEKDAAAMMARAESRIAHEVAGAVHHAGTWYVAHEYHLTRQKAMRDLLGAMQKEQAGVA